MHHHTHHRASLTTLIVCLAIITLMIALALSAARSLTGRIQAGSSSDAATAAAVSRDCSSVASQSLGANAANESAAQLQAEADQAQRCANTAQANLHQ